MASLSSQLTHQKDLMLKLRQTTINEEHCQGNSLGTGSSNFMTSPVAMKKLQASLTTFAAALQSSHDYDRHLRDEGVDKAGRNLLLASQALAQCSIVQEALLEW